MGSRKRTRSEIVPPPEEQSPEQPGLLQRIRDCWEFASLMQYIAIFGKIMKIDEEFEIEVRSLPASARPAICRVCRRIDAFDGFRVAALSLGLNLN